MAGKQKTKVTRSLPSQRGLVWAGQEAPDMRTRPSVMDQLFFKGFEPDSLIQPGHTLQRRSPSGHLQNEFPILASPYLLASAFQVNVHIFCLLQL